MPEICIAMFIAFIVTIGVSLGFRIAQKQVGEDTERGCSYGRLSTFFLILALIYLAVFLGLGYIYLKDLAQTLPAIRI